MITITDSKLLDINTIGNIDNTLCFIGTAIDQRGEDLTRALNIGNQVVELDFDISNYTLKVDDKQVGIIGLSKYLTELILKSEYNQVLIESTILGFVEVLLLLKWFARSDLMSVNIIYAEPSEYKLRTNYMNDFGKHEFDLSTHSEGFKAIPGFAKALTQSQKAILISSMGFERSRLGQLLSLDDGAYIHSVLPIYGTPGFQAGWDKHSFFQNVETLSDKGIKPQFVSANSPLDMLYMLQFIKDSYVDEEITLAPLGTKPLSIASAVFLINNPEVTLKYDHPKRKGRRSTGLGKIHLYAIDKS
jgi:hypothetical protein